MEEPERGLNFDFEGGFASVTTNLQSSIPALPANSTAMITGDDNQQPGSCPILSTDSPMDPNVVRRGSFRQTVCRHWLRSLCMKGDACGFLHQFDKTRMPFCPFFRRDGECREQDCVYKHTHEDTKECYMYKLGFCPKGPGCRYRHAKLPGPPPPVELFLQNIQHLSSFRPQATNCVPPSFAQNQNPNIANQWVPVKPSTTPDMQQQQLLVQQPQPPPVNQIPGQNISNVLKTQGNRTATPLLQGLSRYFIVKSCNRENLELSVQQGVWATQRSNETKLNEAFDSVENVILIFSVNRTRHFQGCAKMTSKIGGFVGGGNWKYTHGTAHYGCNFSVKWLKLCELSFLKTPHLRNPFNDNLPVKISRGCQELEPSIGEQLVALLYLEPDSELMAITIAAESKREEEKAAGVNVDYGAKNLDIVPFEDNEEEEEEDSDEEEDNYNQALAASQGRGKGMGMMWPCHMPLARGGRLMPGIRGFPPVITGGDGYTYGGVTPDGFPMPGHYDVGPRPFPPYGPRFPNEIGGFGWMDGTGPTSGMMFHGRPPGPVFPSNGMGMMMGPKRPPFIGGMGMGAAGPVRANRPVGYQQFRQPLSPQPAQSNPMVKKDQRRTTNDRNDRYGASSDQGKDMTRDDGLDDEAKYQSGAEAQGKVSFGCRSSFRNDDSESEDEAPRWSRHGEGKKKQLASEGDGAAVSDD